MRQSLILGNWKMNGSRGAVAEFVPALRAALGAADVSCGLCLPATLLTDFRLAIAVDEDAPGAVEIGLGAQTVSEYPAGAYTGEVSVAMLEEMACDYVIIGHSERRECFAEDDAQVAAKVKAVVGSSMVPVLCLGETLEQREMGLAEAVINQQLNAVLEVLEREELQRLVVAYEPVWAIGTGKTASPEQAQQIHAFIREQIAKVDGTIAAQIRLLYGGSMKPDNAEALLAQPDIDGGLIGGASLKAEQFAAICHAAQN